jgi:hypothetical protein
MFSRCTIVILLFTFWNVTTPAVAQSSVEEARTYFNSGSAAFREARWLDCVHDFERSFSVMFSPELLYNIGLCYQRAAGALPDAEATPLLERALAAYQRYLREIPNASDADVVRSMTTDVQARLTRAVPVEPVVVELVEPVAVEPVETAHVEVQPPVHVAVQPPAPVVTTEEVPRGKFPITIAAGAVSIVSAAVAIGLGLHAQSLYSGLTSTCGQDALGCSEEQISEVKTFSVGANIMWAVAAVALAGTSIGFALEFTATETRPSRASVSVGGSF